MVEPPAMPPTAARLESDGVLATKLHVPRPRPGLVPRPRLLERLTRATARELTLVCTPAGFGRTTLLADWVRAGQRPVAWLSLYESDNTRPGSGATPPPPWTGCGLGSPSNSPRCLVRRHRVPSRAW
jgi:hypothetical protein